jgi:uncharacterized membrane protein YfcA
MIPMAPATLLLLAVSLVVGLFIGAVGIGGILLIPALAALGPLGMHEAMATALFTFIFTGALGALLFQRRGSIRADLAVPLCAGSLAFGYVGAWANARMDATVLTAILAAVIVFAGAYALRPHRAERAAPFAANPRAQRALLFAIGAIVGFGSGLTGVGGPALSVPLMVMLGFAPLPTIGASQLVQVVASLSGSAANVAHGTIDYALAIPVGLAQLVGVPLGVRIVHAVRPEHLRRAIALLCIAVGAWLALRLVVTPA